MSKKKLFSCAMLGLIFTVNYSQNKIDATGNVGIGIINPQSKLVIMQNTEGISLSGTSIGFNRNISGGQIFNTSRSAWQINAEVDEFRLTGFNGAFQDSFDVFSILENGNFGIGTRNPKNKLSVNGTIWSKEVIVSLTDAADWVFADDYNLKPLAELESFIKRNKHLPEMPSADDFRANDMKVSEMTNRLLQKIEELTLYTIEQEKKLNKIQAELDAVKNK